MNENTAAYSHFGRRVENKQKKVLLQTTKIIIKVSWQRAKDIGSNLNKPFM